ncbi:MAG TPA: hypothetical protein VFR47_32470 [Anaerolineales bacterium]|nr:hypothetical protein [Anaerolineales bacterium]
MKQNASPQKTQIIIVSVLLGIGILVFCVLLAIAFRGNFFPFAASTTQTPTVPVAPTVLVPTVPCDGQTFALGGTTFQIQNLTLAPDSSLAAPPTVSGIAYWLQTTEGNYLFVLSPTPENISLQTALTAESSAKITWADCSSITYSLSGPEPNPANISNLAGQLTSGLTIFFQADESGNGLIVRGEITGMILP